jgi:hypothetical protein
MAAQFQQQQQQQMGSASVVQQMQPGLSGMKRSASSMLDPAAAAAVMPAPAGYPQGMMPVPGSGMMGMVPQQQQQQQRMPYGQQHAYNLQQQGYGMQYQQQMQYPPQQMQMQQQYTQQQMPYGQQQMPYGQQQHFMQQQQQQQQMLYGPGAAGMGAAGPPGMGGMVPMGNGMLPNGMPNGIEEQTVKKQKTEQDKQQLLSTVSIQGPGAGSVAALRQHTYVCLCIVSKLGCVFVGLCTIGCSTSWCSVCDRCSWSGLRCMMVSVAWRMLQASAKLTTHARAWLRSECAA